jgi:hypothetical protein
MGYSKNVS